MRSFFERRAGGSGKSDVLIGLGCLVFLAAGMLGRGLDWTARASRAAPAPEIQRAAELPAAGVLPEKGTFEAAQGLLGDLLWAPDPTEAAWEKMTGDLARIAARHGGRVAIFLKDLQNGRTWSYHGDDLFPSASLIKVPVMASVFLKISEGDLNLDDRLRLRRRHRVGGSGRLRWMRTGSRLSVKSLLYRMINDSDNTATAILIDAIGLDYIQRQLPRMGLFYTEIYKDGMRLTGGRVSRENYTTAREMAEIMEKIYRRELVDEYSSAIMFDMLKHRGTERLAKGLPAGWEIAHKTGLLRRACHDSAIFMTPNGDYSLTVLTGENASYKRAKDFISRLGKVTFKNHRGEGYFAKASSKQRLARR